MIFQRTLKKSVHLRGVGLHSGNETQVRIKPARTDRGIVFVRKDIVGAPEIRAVYKNVVNTQMATTLGAQNVTISTVEHVLAALAGLRIDNAIVEVNGPEIPMLDGSSLPFVQAIEEAGIDTQTVLRPVLALRRKVELKMGEKWAVAEPSSRLEIHGAIDWDHPAIGFQEFHYIEGKTPFSEIAGARSFGFLKDVEALKRMGLGKGASLDNVIVLDEGSVVNPEGLRFPNEFARHKVLDALGDFKLAGIHLQGFIRLHRAGHDLHSQLLNQIFKDPNNYEIIDSSSAVERFPAASIRAALARAGLVASF